MQWRQTLRSVNIFLPTDVATTLGRGLAAVACTMTSTHFDDVDRLMHRAIETGVFPGGVLLIARNGVIAFWEAYGWRNLFTRQVVTTDTVFDLASLTKPLATTPSLMVLAQQSKLALDEPIGTRHRWLKGSDTCYARQGLNRLHAVLGQCP